MSHDKNAGERMTGMDTEEWKEELHKCWKNGNFIPILGFVKTVSKFRGEKLRISFRSHFVEIPMRDKGEQLKYAMGGGGDLSVKLENRGGGEMQKGDAAGGGEREKGESPRHYELGIYRKWCVYISGVGWVPAGVPVLFLAG
jgi:hypothetical protein